MSSCVRTCLKRRLSSSSAGPSHEDPPAHQRIAIPDHHPLRLGTLISILRSVARHKGVTRSSRTCDALKVNSQNGG